ncbi:MAG: hypothetical protein ACI9Q3_001392, partial [Maribacter sp.]
KGISLKVMSRMKTIFVKKCINKNPENVKQINERKRGI